MFLYVLILIARCELSYLNLMYYIVRNNIFINAEYKKQNSLTTFGHYCIKLFKIKNELIYYKGDFMEYYISTKLKKSFDESIDLVTEKLKEQGFGVLTEIDVKTTMKKKLDINFYNYKILGACNPPFAYKALQAEDKIGVMLPCNVIVQEKKKGTVEVSAVDPMASMQAVENPVLPDIAGEVRGRLKKVIDSLK